jgi:mono/diheme cytochrome c family protein
MRGTYTSALLSAAGLAAVVAVSVALSVQEAAVAADAATSPAANQSRFLASEGERLYAASCQACHMADGQGAKGAGAYPSLAGNANLEDPGYALYLVVNGQKAMLPFGKTMTNDQIAAVINYVRSHFGNAYTDAVKPEDVQAVRP